jgi:hypothetical protein
MVMGADLEVWLLCRGTLISNFSFENIWFLGKYKIVQIVSNLDAKNSIYRDLIRKSALWISVYLTHACIPYFGLFTHDTIVRCIWPMHAIPYLEILHQSSMSWIFNNIHAKITRRLIQCSKRYTVPKKKKYSAKKRNTWQAPKQKSWIEPFERSKPYYSTYTIWYMHTTFRRSTVCTLLKCCTYPLLFIYFRVATPFSVARLVMERSKHSILVSEGAQQFAKEHGISVLNNELLQTESSTKAFKVFAIITAPYIVPHIMIYHQRLF